MLAMFREALVRWQLRGLSLLHYFAGTSAAPAKAARLRTAMQSASLYASRTRAGIKHPHQWCVVELRLLLAGSAGAASVRGLPVNTPVRWRQPKIGTNGPVCVS